VGGWGIDRAAVKGVWEGHHVGERKEKKWEISAVEKSAAEGACTKRPQGERFGEVDRKEPRVEREESVQSYKAPKEKGRPAKGGRWRTRRQKGDWRKSQKRKRGERRAAM